MSTNNDWMQVLHDFCEAMKRNSSPFPSTMIQTGQGMPTATLQVMGALQPVHNYIVPASKLGTPLQLLGPGYTSFYHF